MPNYKFTYFDARGRGEPARMLFALVGQEYEDIRYDFEGQEWPQIKGDLKRFPLGKLAVLDIDGELLTQSRAIYRYIAREFKGPDGQNYYGNNNMECAKIDEILGIIADIEIAVIPAFQTPDDDKRVADLITARDTTLKNFYIFFSESLTKSGGKYFVGNRLTLADMAVFNRIQFFLESTLGYKNYFEPYPILVKFYESFKTDSPLTPYLKKRKWTKY